MGGCGCEQRSRQGGCARGEREQFAKCHPELVEGPLRRWSKPADSRLRNTMTRERPPTLTMTFLVPTFPFFPTLTDACAGEDFGHIHDAAHFA